MCATVGTVILIAVGNASARAARARLSFEKWHAILLIYVGVALSFVHQLAGPDLAGHCLLQVVWALLYTHVFGLLVRHRVITPIMQAAQHRMRVVAIVAEGPGVVSIEVEGQHLTELEAESGQFFRWRFLGHHPDARPVRDHPLHSRTGPDPDLRARSTDQLLFRRALDEIARSRGARVHYLLGDDTGCLPTAALVRLVPNLAERDVYMCGPPRMTDAIRVSLPKAGLADDDIHEERFTF